MMKSLGMVLVGAAGGRIIIFIRGARRSRQDPPWGHPDEKR
jgi:hypothetical protein